MRNPLKFTNKAQVAPTERKSIANLLPPGDLSFTEFLVTNGNGDLGVYSAIQLYMRCMPLFNAIAMRAEAFSQIPIKVQDIKTKEFVPDHPALELLRKPNADVSQMEFLEQISSFYDITGDSFLGASGRVTNPPLELFAVPPQEITFATGDRFGLLFVPDKIWLSNPITNFLYSATEVPSEGIRYYNEMQDQELWHMRTFNPLRSNANFRGLSKARPIWLEAEQYIAGNNTNLSMLKRGTKLSLAWVNNRGEELTDKQWDRLQEEAQKYAGDINTGGTPILDGMDVKAIQQSNRDMEFKDLQSAMLARISAVYKIPLAMLLAETMTLNNLETAQLQFFDNSVLPLADRLYDEMTRFLMPRYKNSENLRFTFNENDITALRLRRLETAKAQSEVNVNTINEIRKTIGDEEIEGGDVILRPATLIPISQGALGDDIDDMTEDDKQKVSSKFRQMLREKKFTEEQIEEAAKNAGL